MNIYNSTKNIENEIRSARMKSIDVNEVIFACDELSRKISFEEHVAMFEILGISQEIAKEYLINAKDFLSATNLEGRVKTELSHYNSTVESHGKSFSLRTIPVGTILHIGASNADALAAYSVIEGLLTGNLNLVKLPKEDVFSVVLLDELVKIQPKLTEFIFLFDIPSSNRAFMAKLIEFADIVAVWGSDSAVKGVRELCPANVKIVEWGHKISFAYATMECTDDDLRKVAINMCKTDGLYCSSCQGVFLDTRDMDALNEFAKRFLNILRIVRDGFSDPNIYLEARKSLEFYTEKLEAVSTKKTVYKDRGVGVIAYADSQPQTSYMFAHCWVKRLHRDDIASILIPHKNHLQTVALLCNEKERPHLESVLIKTGLTRIFADASAMSTNYLCLPHDGVFALSQYVKVASVELL